MQGMLRTLALALLAGAVALAACKKSDAIKSQSAPERPAVAKHLVGLVTDVGGRGDQSFNDSALRGLETWAAGVAMEGGSYRPLSAEQLAARGLRPLPVQPLVVQSKAQEDYEPNLQLLVDQGAALTIAVGFMLENAVEAIARRNPQAKFLLIDSPILDAKGAVLHLPNVRTVVFREHEGSFLAGALAGLVSTRRIGFVGGMEIPLIKKFESGFRAGVRAVRPAGVSQVLASYTGSFDNVSAGKQVGQDMLNQGVDVVFQAAGADGLGVIQAAKEAREAGKTVWAIGVDSDQHALAPQAMLTSMVKRVDWVVFEACRDLVEGTFTSGDLAFGLREDGVTLAPTRADFPGKAEALERVESLRQRVVSQALHVPSNPEELEAFVAAP